MSDVFKFLWNLINSVLTLCLYAAIAYYFYKLFVGGKTIKTTRRYRGFFGQRTTEVEYHETGRRVKHTTRPAVFGGTITETQEVNKGSKKCFKYGASVSPGGDGRYNCCGRSFY